MEEPYILNLDGSQPQYLTEQYGMEYQIKFSKWNPYSSDWQYKIPYDSVMTISNPEPGLQEAYENKIKEKREVLNQNDRYESAEDSENENES